MYPDIERPKIDALELMKLCPNLRKNPVFYKCYYLYLKYKHSFDGRVLTEEAFNVYYN
jgi:hypothetical protein